MRKTKKSLERQREEERQKKEQELESEYAELRATADKIRWPLAPKDDWIKRKLEEWNRSQLRIPSGMYQDRAKVVATYQQRFVEYTKQLCPTVFEKLRKLEPCFSEVFDAEPDKCLEIFDRSKMEFFDLNIRLENIIQGSILKTPFVSFRPNRVRHFRIDYAWGEYRTLFGILYILFVEDATTDRRNKAITDIASRVSKDLAVDWSQIQIDDQSQFERVNDHFTSQILEAILIGAEREGFMRGARTKVEQFLKGIVPDPLRSTGPFVDLVYRLLWWAERSRLEKTWLLRYALHFLSLFHKDPKIAIRELEVPVLTSRSLVGYPFEFTFPGWLAGDERKEDYEKRLRSTFDAELQKYFHRIHLYLDLGKVKRVTYPIKLDKVKWLVRYTVQGWSKARIIEEIESEFEAKTGREKEGYTNPLDKAFRQLKAFDLPVRNQV